MGIVNALSSEWRSIMKGNAFTPPSPLNESSYFLSVKGEMMDILNVRSKMCSRSFVPINQPRLLLKPNGKANIQAFWAVSGQKYTLCLLRWLDSLKIVILISCIYFTNQTSK